MSSSNVVPSRPVAARLRQSAALGVPALVVVLITTLLLAGRLGQTSYTGLFMTAVVLGMALHWSDRVKKVDFKKGTLDLRDAQAEVVAVQRDPQIARPVLDRIQSSSEALAATLDQLQDQVDQAKQMMRSLDESQKQLDNKQRQLLGALTQQVEADIADLRRAEKPDRTLLENAVSSSTGLAAMQLRGWAPSVVIGIPTHNVFETIVPADVNRRSEGED